jgi:hypothetical protein
MAVNAVSKIVTIYAHNISGIFSLFFSVTKVKIKVGAVLKIGHF